MLTEESQSKGGIYHTCNDCILCLLQWLCPMKLDKDRGGARAAGTWVTSHGGRGTELGTDTPPTPILHSFSPVEKLWVRGAFWEG